MKQTDDSAARLDSARAEARMLNQELHETRRQLGRALEVRDVLADAAKALTPPPRLRLAVRPGKKSDVRLLVLWGDLHIGEVVNARETEDWGRFNYAIAEARTTYYAESLLNYVATQRHGYTLADCDVVCLGDMVGGDIHEELSRTNEVPPPVQAVLAGRLTAQLVSALSPAFRNIKVHVTSGSNHSRLTKKYQFKGGTLNSYDWVAGEVAREILRDHGNVRLEILPSKKNVIKIGRYRFLCGHGDHIKSWMGIPYYGIARDLGREAERRLQRLMDQLRAEVTPDGGFDYGLGGHWHAPFVGPNFRYIVNGSLTGTNELDHALGRNSPPQQVAALVSDKHGLFGPVSFRLDREAVEAPLTGRSVVDDLFGG